jgi:hypothetical protein
VEIVIQPSGVTTSAKHRANQHANTEGDANGQQGSLANGTLNPWSKRAVQLIQELL